MPGSLLFFIFYVVDNINLSGNNLNNDLSKINAWANQWKMTFNPDPNKQAQETSHHPLNFNNNLLNKYIFKKTWVFIWTVKWTFVNILKKV